MVNSESELCLSCGLCCDGSLFQLVKLEPGEAQSGLRLVPAHDAFAQPCGCLTGTRCDIYDDRPAACRRFRCRLLAHVGPIGPALAIVARTRELLTGPRTAELDQLLDEHFSRAR